MMTVFLIFPILDLIKIFDWK